MSGWSSVETDGQTDGPIAERCRLLCEAKRPSGGNEKAGRLRSQQRGLAATETA